MNLCFMIGGVFCCEISYIHVLLKSFYVNMIKEFIGKWAIQQRDGFFLYDGIVHYSRIKRHNGG